MLYPSQHSAQTPCFLPASSWIAPVLLQLRRTWAFVERQPLDGVAAAASGRRQSVLVSHARTCTARARPAPGGHVLTPSTSPLLTPAVADGCNHAPRRARPSPCRWTGSAPPRSTPCRTTSVPRQRPACPPHHTHYDSLLCRCRAVCVCVCVCVCARARVRALLLGGAEPQDERSRLHQVRRRLGVAAADGGLAARARGY